jgi:hypothetical protein
MSSSLYYRLVETAIHQVHAALTAKHAAIPLSDPDKNAVAVLTSEPIPQENIN